MAHRTIWETRSTGETEEDRSIARLTRRETERERRARIARKAIDPETAAALRRLWGAS